MRGSGLGPVGLLLQERKGGVQPRGGLGGLPHTLGSGGSPKTTPREGLLLP